MRPGRYSQQAVEAARHAAARRSSRPAGPRAAGISSAVALVLLSAGCGSSQAAPMPLPLHERGLPKVKPSDLGPLGPYTRLPDGQLEAPVATTALFALDSAVLRPGASRLLSPLLPVAVRVPGAVEVIGRTDGLGTAVHNLVLSHARAQAVAEFLVQHGISRGRIRVCGIGEAGAVDGLADPDLRAVIVRLG